MSLELKEYNNFKPKVKKTKSTKNKSNKNTKK